MQKADMGIKSPVDMMYYSQPWMFVTIFPISLLLEGKFFKLFLLDTFLLMHYHLSLKLTLIRVDFIHTKS